MGKNPRKQSQSERLKVAERILTEIDEEFEEGKMDPNILQTAVYCQVSINRIVFALNKLRNGKDEHKPYVKPEILSVFKGGKDEKDISDRAPDSCPYARRL